MMKVSEEVEPWVRLKTVAGHLDMTVQWVRDRAAIIPHVRVGHEYRFRLSEVDAWIEQWRGGER